ncbi:transposase [uncultured Peptoniphilus sp.]|uniref:transposase n=1 Tax=uncultured Peptoniphilus sp. TaxID=254354 RepID=UPI00338F8CD4
MKIGTLALRVSKIIYGKFLTDVFKRYQRIEKALLTTMLEMHIHGVKVRKISNLIEKLC